MNITISQTVRPIKLALFVRPNNINSYLRAIKLCSSLWGGKNFPILPLHKKFSKNFQQAFHLINETPIEFYANTLINFSVDYVVADDGLDLAYIKSFVGDLKVISASEIEESLLMDECKFGIALNEILRTFKEKELKYIRADKLNVMLPKINNDIYLSTLVGNVDENYLARLKEVKSEEITYPNISNANLGEFFKEDVISYLQLNSYSTNTFGNPFWSSQFAIYLLDKKNLLDCTIFWNLRALGWNIVPIPIEDIEEPFYSNLINTQQREFKSESRIIDRISILFNKDITKEVFNKCYEYIANIPFDNPVTYIVHSWIPRFWNSLQSLHYDKTAAVFVQANSVQFENSIIDGKVKLDILSPPIGSKYMRHAEPRFINDINIEFDEVEAKHAQVLPKMSASNLDFIIRGSGHSQWKFDRGSMCFVANNRDTSLAFSIPLAKEVFEKWFIEKGIEIRQSAPGKLANQLLKSIGGIYGINFFVNPAIPTILGLFENGKIVLKKSLDAVINRNLKSFRVSDKGIPILRLLQKSIIEFGSEIQCAYCNQRSFYKLSDVTEKIKCPVCHNSFMAPMHNPEEMKWAYRGLGPFSKNNKAEGVLSVLLTLRFFKITMGTSQITPYLNFELIKNGVVFNEVDLGIFYKKFNNGFKAEDLFFCECKTEIDFAKKDVTKMKNLAVSYPGCILVFATLKKELSKSEKSIIIPLVKSFRKGIRSRAINPVLILTGNELLPETVFNPLINIEGLIVPHMQFSDEMGHLCDVTCQKYLGLPSFESIVAERVEELIKKRKVKNQSDNI